MKNCFQLDLIKMFDGKYYVFSCLFQYSFKQLHFSFNRYLYTENRKTSFLFWMNYTITRI